MLKGGTSRYIIFATLFLSLCTGIFLSPRNAEAFGISPPFINADRLVPGVKYETTIFLVQGSPEKDTRIQLAFEVPEKIKAWISTDQGEEFVIPAGVRQFPMKVTIAVPQDTDLGFYQGQIRVRTVPDAVEGAQVTVAVGAVIDVNLTVGDNVIADYVIRNLDILDIREGEPPQITITIENIGNVPIAPDQATFDLYDKFGDVRIGFAQTEELEETPAFETKTFIVEFPLNIRLGIGEYWADARIYRGGEVAKSLKTVFNVTEGPEWWELPWVWAGSAMIVLLILGGIVFGVRAKRRVGAPARGAIPS